MSAVEHRFGPYGGQYVPETLMPALAELEEAWVTLRQDAGYRAELAELLRDFAGRPSPLYLARRLRRKVEIAGVFVNATIDEIVATSELVPLSLVQLHGDEGPMYATEVARRTGARVIKAARVQSKADVQALDAFRTQDFHLLDTLVPGEAGGTGQTFDWSLAGHRVSSVPLILSGGLTPENVGEAVAQVGPWGVDVASGTEREPGVKDPA